MKTNLTHKGYTCIEARRTRSGRYYGEIHGLRDVICFYGKNAEEFKKAMEDSVDDYLSFCEGLGAEPEKPQINE